MGAPSAPTPSPSAARPASSTGQARVTRLYLRLLGLVFVFAFVSIAVQARILMGSRGLLPIAPVLEALRAREGGPAPWQFPTIFWLGASDGSLLAAAWAGAALGLALLLGLRSRLALAAAFLLFLSLVLAGRIFFHFQWDNLLLETSFLSLLLPMPWIANLRGGAPEAPPSVFVCFLFRWLLFRLYFESGVSKLLPGAQGWTDLTAMSHYFETAPLPSWIGWLAHQQPHSVARAVTALTLVLEIGLPFLIFGPRRLRHLAFAIFGAMQLTFFLTASYGYFNVLSTALSVWLLHDRDLESLAARLRIRLAPLALRAPPRGRALVVGAIGSFLFLASVIEGAELFAGRTLELPGWVESLRGLYTPSRIVNTYHLFANMTEKRIEVTIEGSDDGATWKPYRFKYKPGDPRRRPPIAAPHQPRVDFQLWFFTISPPGGPQSVYVEALLRRICHDPAALSGLWSEDPFHGRSPKRVRIGFDDYRMTDLATLRATGRWWNVRRVGSSREFACSELGS